MHMFRALLQLWKNVLVDYSTLKAHCFSVIIILLCEGQKKIIIITDTAFHEGISLRFQRK